MADAATGPAAAAAAMGAAAAGGGSSGGGAGSNSSSPMRLSLPGTTGSVRGRAAHLVPVPLHVLDMAAAGYYGRYVESHRDSADSGGGSGSSTAATSGRTIVPAASSGGVKRSQLLYLQAAGQLNVAGPIALEQLGVSTHAMRVPGAGAAGAAGFVAGGGSTGVVGRWA